MDTTKAGVTTIMLGLLGLLTPFAALGAGPPGGLDVNVTSPVLIDDSSPIRIDDSIGTNRIISLRSSAIDCSEGDGRSFVVTNADGTGAAVGPSDRFTVPQGEAFVATSFQYGVSTLPGRVQVVVSRVAVSPSATTGNVALASFAVARPIGNQAEAVGAVAMPTGIVFEEGVEPCIEFRIDGPEVGSIRASMQGYLTRQ